MQMRAAFGCLLGLTLALSASVALAQRAPQRAKSTVTREVYQRATGMQRLATLTVPSLGKLDVSCVGQRPTCAVIRQSTNKPLEVQRASYAANASGGGALITLSLSELTLVVELPSP